MSRTIRDDFYQWERKSFRDKKKNYKAISKCKKVTKTQERAKVKDSLHHLDEDETKVPRFKKHNDYDFG